MLGAILLLGFVAFGLACLMGTGRPQRLGNAILALIFVPVLLSVLLSIVWAGAVSYFAALPLAIQIVVLLALPFLLLACLRVALPKSAMVQRLTERAWDTAAGILAFPIRLIWRVGLHLIQKERRTIPLSRHPRVVGNRAPLRDRERFDGRDW